MDERFRLSWALASARLSWALAGALAACGSPAADPAHAIPASTAESEGVAQVSAQVSASGTASAEHGSPAASAIDRGPANEGHEEGDPTAPAAAGVTLAPVAHSIRLVLLQETESLPSERRELNRLREGLARGGRAVELVRPGPAEQTVAAAWFVGRAGNMAADVAAEWAQAETVILMRKLGARTDEQGRRFTRGATGVVVLRPGDDEALLTLDLDEVAAWYLDGQRWAGWLGELLDMAARGAQ